jgi:L-alanine-DL-glutamate epimerase-like enolase superfamily enzyme
LELSGFAVELVEQPLPAGNDAILADFRPAIPVAADESFQSLDDIGGLTDRYQAVNIKLDKCGGLTEALLAARAARELGLGVMVGCMLGTSLGLAPAFLAAMLADHADLDGALHLQADRAGGMTLEGSDLGVPEVALWG